VATITLKLWQHEHGAGHGQPLTHAINAGTAFVNGVNLGENSTATSSVSRLFLTTPPSEHRSWHDGSPGDRRQFRVEKHRLSPSSWARRPARPADSARPPAPRHLRHLHCRDWSPSLESTDESRTTRFTATDNTRITATTPLRRLPSTRCRDGNERQRDDRDGITLTDTSGAILFGRLSGVHRRRHWHPGPGGCGRRVFVNAGTTATLSAIISGTRA